MNRKEKREKANKRRLEIVKQIHTHLKEIAETIPKEIKTDPYSRWGYILKKGDEWVIGRMRMCPQEAHMYKSAAIIVKNTIQKVLKNE